MTLVHLAQSTDLKGFSREIDGVYVHHVGTKLPKLDLHHPLFLKQAMRNV
jgi:hypothetical protein